MNKEFVRLTRPIYVLFIVMNVVPLFLNKKLESYQINVNVVIAANLLLFVISMLNLYFQSKNIHNPNQSAVIRGVMAGTFLKLMGLAAAAIIYLVAAGANRSVNAVFVGMGLYVIYTWLEVKISLQLKPKK